MQEPLVEGVWSGDIFDLVPELTYEIPNLGSFDLRNIVLFLLTFLVLSVVCWLIRRFVLDRLCQGIFYVKHSDKLKPISSIIFDIKIWVLYYVSFYLAVQVFVLPAPVEVVFTGLFYMIVTWQVIDIITRLVDRFMTAFLERKAAAEGDLDADTNTISHMFTLTTKILLWVLGMVFVLANLGVEVTSLLAGLGIGGVAVAFALQGVLGDLFASLSIYMDRPFRIGDFIMVGADMGTVEKIGIKSTRIRTLQGEQLVISNKELTSSRVQNFKQMDRRRVPIQIGVPYDTPLDKLREIPAVTKEVVESIAGVTFDRSHLLLLGDYSYVFEVVFYVESSDYLAYMDCRHAFNLALLERFASFGVTFAYPTQVQHVKMLG